MIDLYILDEQFREVAMINAYESLIWTERFDRLGDIEIQIGHDQKNANLLGRGTILSIPQSNRMMIVESILTRPAGGRNFMKIVTGPSLEKILHQRVGQIMERRSYKPILNRMVEGSLITPAIDTNDKIPNLSFGTNRLYPASSIGPDMTMPGKNKEDWGEVGEMHDRAGKQGSLGYRLVRKPRTQQLYYDNYTGMNRSQSGNYDVENLELSFSNPYFSESDEDMVVWRNLATNGGFTDGFRPLATMPIEHEEHPRLDVKEVEVDWSVSGKGLLVRTKTTPTAPVMSNQGVYLTGGQFETNGLQSLGVFWGGSQWAGRRCTLRCKIQVLNVQDLTLTAPYRRAVVFYRATTAGGTIEPYASFAAPNTVGIHTIEQPVTLPHIPTYSYFGVRIMNGNSVEDPEDGGIILGDFQLVDGDLAPSEYFDHNHSFDSDLYAMRERYASWDYREGRAEYGPGVLVGSVPRGFSKENMLGCAVVQSNKWSSDKGVSARIIRTQTIAAGPHWAELNLEGLGHRRLQYDSWQDGPVTPLDQGQLGAVQKYNNTTAVGAIQGAGRANTQSEYRSTLSVNNGNFNKVRFLGGHRHFGKSVWIDKFVASPLNNPAWVPVPNTQVLLTDSLGTFEVSESLDDIEQYRNVVYVMRRDFVVQVTDGYVGDLAMRRVIYVDANDLENDGGLQRLMEDLGRRALQEHKSKFLIDGSIPPYSRFVYDTDYYLGDVVTVRDHAGRSTLARVSEHIFSQTAEGFRSYSTLVEETTVLAGEWHSPEYNIIWDTALNTWSDQP